MYSVPIPVLRGGVFNATILVGEKTVEVVGAWILAPGHNYTLELVAKVSAGSYLIVTLKAPADAVPELYDLYIRISEGLLHSPRSVWVLDEWPTKISFLHFTDVHIGILTGGVPSWIYYETAIGILNALDVDFAVITGDEVDVGSDVPSLKKLREITNKARKPTFMIPGNHDHSQTDEVSFQKKFYGFYVGPATWYRVLGNFLIVGLDTGAEGFLDSKQLKWLEGVLAAHRGKVKILLMHHPLFNYGVYAKITGSWKEIDKLSNYLYGSWHDHMGSAKEFLRLVEEYNVTVVLAGHVHGDGFVFYNKRTWFITTTTTCAGVREGDYRGFKLIVLDSKGKLYQVGVPGLDPFKGFCAYNIEKARIVTYVDSSLTAYTIEVKLSSGFKLSIENATVFFYVNASIPTDAYKFYGDTKAIKEYKIYPYGNLYLVKVIVDLKPPASFKLTFSSYEDKEPPVVKIQLYTPRNPVSGKDALTLYIKAEDKGWGLESIKVIVQTDATKREFPASYVSEGSYQVRIPPLRVSKIKVKAVATDHAGNVGESQEIEISYKVPSQAQQQQQQQQQQKEKPEKEEVEIEVPTPNFMIIAAVIAIAAIAVGVMVYVLVKRSR